MSRYCRGAAAIKDVWPSRNTSRVAPKSAGGSSAGSEAVSTRSSFCATARSNAVTCGVFQRSFIWYIYSFTQKERDGASELIPHTEGGASMLSSENNAQ